MYVEVVICVGLLGVVVCRGGGMYRDDSVCRSSRVGGVCRVGKAGIVCGTVVSVVCLWIVVGVCWGGHMCWGGKSGSMYRGGGAHVCVWLVVVSRALGGSWEVKGRAWSQLAPPTYWNWTVLDLKPTRDFIKSPCCV